MKTTQEFLLGDKKGNITVWLVQTNITVPCDSDLQSVSHVSAMLHGRNKNVGMDMWWYLEG